MTLPDPAPGADALIERFWRSVRTPERLPPDGTAADAMREGLNGIHRAGLRARGLPVLLLAALYATLVADGFGENTGMAARLSTITDSDVDIPVLTAHLSASRGHLLSQLRNDPAITERACEHARAWTGAELDAQVRAAITTTDTDLPAAVLLAIAAAVATQPTP